ncbi:MAG: amidase [Deltaproteobacteria bacterium]|nr:amidase [Deltaproteobacteria bacterium]
MAFDPHVSLVALAAQIQAKQLSPSEVLRAYLARIERFNGELNAIVTLDAERALVEAHAVEQRLARGDEVGPLAGVPFAAKDLEDVGGMRTTYGSPLFAEHVPVQDSINVARLRAAGAIILGKTNTPEFGSYMQSSNPVFGATRNPWNLERTPGGSSGGAAAALVAGLVPLATASDGGGSIRHPAAFTGCVGLKPTFRRVPARPDRTLTFDDTGVWGPLTLTVRDAARLADVTFGPDEEDPSALPLPGESYEATVDQPPRRLRIAWCPDLGHFVQPDVAREVDAAARVVQALGHAVEVFNEPMPFVGKAWSLTSIVNEYLKHGDGLATPDKLDPMLREGFLRARERAADDLAYAYARRTELVRWTARAFARFDVLMMPTLPLEAFPIGVVHPTEIAGRPVRIHDVFPFTHPFNLSGHPALSLPAGFTDAGLPAAIQFVAPRFQEAVLLRLGRQFELARPWPLAPDRYRSR